MKTQKAPSALEIRRHILDTACRSAPLLPHEPRVNEALSQLCGLLRVLSPNRCLTAIELCQKVVGLVNESAFENESSKRNNKKAQLQSLTDLLTQEQEH